MTLLHPWAIAMGVAGLSLPIVVHWLTRPRPVRLPLSTIRFVQEVIRQRRAFHRLRDVLILSLRALAVGLIAWAFARPLGGQSSRVALTQEGKVARVILLDASQSMVAQRQGVQAFERARSVAAGYLGTQFGLQADVILAGATPRPVFGTLSQNLAAQREELAKARPRPERLNVRAALTRVSEIFASGPSGQASQRELVVISDFQETNWGEADFAALPKDVAIRLESVAPAQPLANVGLLRCGAAGRTEPGRPVRLEAEVGNYSSSPRPVQVEVTLGESVYRLEGLCPAGGTTVLATDVEFAQAGWLTGQARLVNLEDALSADNVRPLVVRVRPSPTYALITRQAGDRVGTSSYFLARALAPGADRTGNSGEKVVWIPPGRVDRPTLAGADLIVLDHPGKLSEPAATLLSGLMRFGQPILYVASEDADATNLRMIVDAANPDLRMPVEFLPSNKKPRRDLTLVDIARDQPPFSIFGESVLATTAGLRLSGGLPTWRTRTGLPEDILASLSDESAFLVWATCGTGGLAVMNADLAASNLARSPAFVPLLGELVNKMHGRQQAGQGVACGEPMSMYLPSEAGLPEGLTIAGPAGRGDADTGDLAEDGMGVMWRWQGPDQPGAYEVLRGESAVYAAAGTIPAEESDLRPLAGATLKDRLAGDREVTYHGVEAGQQEPDEWWPWLAVTCVACVLAEVVALKVFRT